MSLGVVPSVMAEQAPEGPLRERVLESHELSSTSIQLPDGYAENETEHYLFTFPQRGKTRADAIMAQAESIRAQLVAEIGVDPPGKTRVYLAANGKDFQTMQPGGRRVPDWVAGIAYTRLNVVLLRQAGSQGQAIDLMETFRHEMSHIILRNVVGDNPMPKWFVEGLAQWQARQFELERALRLSKALISGRLMPMDDLTQRFPSNPMDVHLAYDQSFEFVNYMVGEFGEEKFHRFFKRLGKGEAFASALEETYGKTQNEIEIKWLSSLKMNYNWIPLIMSGTTVWTVASILFLMGYFKRRRDRKKKMDAWEAEEQAMDRTLRSLNEPQPLRRTGHLQLVPNRQEQNVSSLSSLNRSERRNPMETTRQSSQETPSSSPLKRLQWVDPEHPSNDDEDDPTPRIH